MASAFRCTEGDGRRLAEGGGRAVAPRLHGRVARLGHLILRAKWTMDGATTLAEAAARHRGRAEELDELARAGFELEEPVHDDYAFIVRPGEESPMRLVEEDE